MRPLCFLRPAAKAPEPHPEHTQESAQAAGHNNPVKIPVRSVVTAACATLSVTEAAAPGNDAVAAGPSAAARADPSREANPHPSTAATVPWIDFAHLKSH